MTFDKDFSLWTEQEKKKYYQFCLNGLAKEEKPVKMFRLVQISVPYIDSYNNNVRCYCKVENWL